MTGLGHSMFQEWVIPINHKCHIVIRKCLMPEVRNLAHLARAVQLVSRQVQQNYDFWRKLLIHVWQIHFVTFDYCKSVSWQLR
jgi:hypothetical protein